MRIPDDLPDNDALIYHATSKSDWEAAKEKGIFDRSTRGKSFTEVGFIHASGKDQIQRIIDFIYGKTDEELVLLTLNKDELAHAGIEVKYEDGGDGELFPHIYAPIPTALITSSNL